MHNKFGEKVIVVHRLIAILEQLPSEYFVGCNVVNNLRIHASNAENYLGYIDMLNETVHMEED